MFHSVSVAYMLYLHGRHLATPNSSDSSELRILDSVLLSRYSQISCSVVIVSNNGFESNLISG